MNTTQFFINGRWVDPISATPHPVINPATEEPIASISLASHADVDAAVSAARAAFPSYRVSSKEERLAVLRRLLEALEDRKEEMAQAISQEMGAPIDFARAVQVERAGLGRLKEMIAALEEWQERGATRSGAARLVRQPIGVCALITPWNYPLNQIAQKVYPALAAGCTMVLKPSENAPLDAIILAECLAEAGCPPGVFNLLNGLAETGAYMAGHPDVDMVSLTGSVQAGVSVSKTAADKVKRVSLELGGKSPCIIFADADLQKATDWGVKRVMANAGQTCTATTRMLVERSVYDQLVDQAAAVAQAVETGDPSKTGGHMGPVVSAAQFERVQSYIATAIAEGARLVAGGLGRPEGSNKGYYVRPTVFADVSNDMTIAREEIFGPVLSIIPFEDEAEAVRIANDTDYGLAAQIFTQDSVRAERVAMAMEAGMVGINGTAQGVDAPFGGFKQSGNGREGGVWGLEEYTELKAISGL